MDSPSSHTPRFSVLTPAFNAEATIGRAIDSVLAQQCGDWEMVIVDDGSHDGTRGIASEYAERDPRIRVIECPHRGLAATRLEAMQQARGELFARLDADDCLLEDYLSRVDAVFRACPSVQIVSTNGYQVFPDGRRVPYYTADIFQTAASLTISDMLRGVLFGTSAVMSRSVFDLTGGPRPEARSEDVDLWLRAVAMGAVHRHLPERLFLYYQGRAGQLSGDARAVWRSRVEILTHLIDQGLLSGVDINLAERAIRGYRLRLALHWDRWGASVRVWMSRRGVR